MIQCERNLKDEKNGQRHGGKEERQEERREDRKAGCRGVAAVRVKRRKRCARGTGSDRTHCLYSPGRCARL